MSVPITEENFQTIFVQLLAPHIITTEERTAFFEEAFFYDKDILYHLDFDGSANRFANHAIAKISDVRCEGLRDLLDVLSGRYGRSNPVQTQIEGLRGQVDILCQLPQRELIGTRRQSTGNTKLFCNIPLRDVDLARQSHLNVLDDWYFEDLGNSVMLLLGGEGTGKTSLAWSWQDQLTQNEHAPSIIYWWQFDPQRGINELTSDFARTLKAPLEQKDLLEPTRVLIPRLKDHFSRLKSLLLILDDFDFLLQGSQEWTLLGKETGDWPTWKREFVDITTEFLIDLILDPEISIKTLITSTQIPFALERNGGKLRDGVRKYALNSGLGLERAKEIFAGYELQDLDKEVEKLCRPVRYFPLSVHLLAGYLSHLPAPHTDIFSRRDLDVKENQEKVIGLAWDYITEVQRSLLIMLAVLGEKKTLSELSIIMKLEGATIDGIESNLDYLVKRGFLKSPNAQGRYKIHTDLRNYIHKHVLSAAEHRRKNQMLANYYARRIADKNSFQDRVACFHHLIEKGDCNAALTFFIEEIQTSILYEDVPDIYLAEINLLDTFMPYGPVGSCLEFLFDRLRVLNYLGSLYIEMGLLTQAGEYIEEYLDILLTEQLIKNYPLVQCWEDSYPLMGNFLIPTGRFRDGLAYITWRQRVLTKDRSLDELPADVHYFMAIEETQRGRILAYSGRFDEAEAAFHQALNVFQTYQKGAGKNVYPLLTLGYLAEFLLIVGRAGNALKLMVEGMPDQEGKTKSIRDHLDELKQYLESHSDEDLDGRSLFLELDILEQEQIKIDWLLGWAYTQLESYEKAHEHLNLAEKEGDRVKAYDFLPSIKLSQARLKLVEIPNSHDLSQVSSEIHADLDKGERIALRAGQLPVMADLHNIRAAVLVGEMRFAEARQRAELARRIAFKCDLPSKYQTYAERGGRLIYKSFPESEEIIRRVDELEKMI
ncbi:MAG: hypothetical protein AAF633_12805 [Chloroflexota bacterium]